MSTKPMLIVALDIGTTGAKAALVDRAGRLLASGYAGYETFTSAGNQVEQEPEEWWRAVCTALHQLWSQAPTAIQQVAAIALSGQMQDLILLGAEDTLGRAILYSDSRAQAEAAFLAETMGAAELARITGNEQGAASLLAKWRWLAAHEPTRLAASQTILLGAHNYISWRLCGVTACDYTTASTTGLLDLTANQWATTLLQQLGLDERKLPMLLPADALLGNLTPQAAAASGLPTGVPVYTGAGDLAATTVGVGADEPGRVYCYLGTSGWIATSLENATPNPVGGVFTLRHPDTRRFIQVAPMLTAGGNLDWVRTTVAGAEEYATINALAADTPAGSHGLLYLPYLAGERSPFSDPNARACYIGISSQTTRSDLVRAVMEGTAYAYWTLLDALEVKTEALYVVGGGAKSPVWMQILADVLGRPVHVVAAPGDAAARGAAILVGRALGWYASLTLPGDFSLLEQTYRPDARIHTAYQALYPIFTGLYAQLRGTFGALAQGAVGTGP